MANVFKRAMLAAVRNQLNIFINDVAEEARRNAPTTKPSADGRSKGIRDSIKVDPARDNEEIVYASVYVDLDDAPEARAYEYGSGVHGKSGDKYPIAPKNSPSMVFWWKPPFGDLTGGKLPWIFLKSKDPLEGLIAFDRAIMHPGVKARPYLRPAFEKHLKGFRGKLLKAVKVEIGFGFTERTIEKE